MEELEEKWKIPIHAEPIHTKEGADTIIWLLLTEESLTSGSFYFDRKIVLPYLSKNYNPTREQRITLLNKINNYIVKLL